MTASGRGHGPWVGLAVVTAVLLGVAGLVLWPVGPDGYRDRVVAAAEGALSAVRTTVLAGAADTLSSHRLVLVDDAREDIATSLHDLAVEEAPDEAGARLRDELQPLLERALALLTDEDPAQRHREQLGTLGDALAAFVEHNR